MSEHEKRLEDLFHDALERDTAARELLLQERCGDDHELRREVEEMLAVHEDAEDFFAQPALDLLSHPRLSGETVVGLDLEAGQEVGGFRIVRLIGAGGMGSVYEATQQDPKRTVALKVLRNGIADPRSVRRFQFEVAILAALQHPGIAHVYEAGLHREGRLQIPFFVMEYVPDAKSLTGYADDAKLGLQARLELFLQVCDAVHHGHQKGVIHRDLKPENILVDSRGRARVIDFGVARATDLDVSVSASLGTTGFLGTLRYMSPEQCGGDALQVDSRSDVYSLGVILYVLLTGKHPYEFDSNDFTRIIRTIQEQRPAPLTGRLRGDLETVVRKALEKERKRRYSSVAELAADLRRWLRREPITARPPSATYHFRRLVERHRVASALSLLLFLSLVAFAITATVQSVRVGKERDRASGERDRATGERDKAIAVRSFLERVLAGDRIRSLGQDVKVVELIDLAAQELATTETNDPHVELASRRLIGTAYWRLGRFQEAEAQVERCLELVQLQEPVNPSDQASLLQLYGTVLSFQSNWTDSEVALRQAWNIAKTIESPRAASLLAIIRGQLGNTLRQAGRMEEARAEFEASIALRQELEFSEPEMATVYENYATLLTGLGEFDQARSLLEESLRLLEGLYPDGHPDVGLTLAQLGNLEYSQGKPDRARELWEQAIVLYEKYLGTKHPDVVTLRGNVASVQQLRGNLEAAELNLKLVLEARRESFASHPMPVATALQKLADVKVGQKKNSEAVTLLEEALEIRKRVAGDRHVSLGNVYGQMAHVAILGEDFETGARASMSAIKVLRANGLAGKAPIAGVMLLHALALTGLDRAVDAEFFAREALEIRSQFLAPNSWQVSNAKSALAECLIELSRFDEAETLLLEAYPTLVEQLHAEATPALRARDLLIRLYERWGKPEKAAQFRS